MINNEKSYNGWSNYATWRINLEIFDGQTAEDVLGSAPDEDDDEGAREHILADALKSYVEETVLDAAEPGLVRDYAEAFVSDVDWYEIARNMLAE